MSTSYDTAAAILPLVGGPANATSVAHCMTPLCLGLADRSLVDEEALRAVGAPGGPERPRRAGRVLRR